MYFQDVLYFKFYIILIDMIVLVLIKKTPKVPSRGKVKIESITLVKHIFEPNF